jgi:hypothetical protein
MAVAGCNYFTITLSLTIRFNSARVDYMLKRFDLRFLIQRLFEPSTGAKIVVTSAYVPCHLADVLY